MLGIALLSKSSPGYASLNSVTMRATVSLSGRCGACSTQASAAGAALAGGAGAGAVLGSAVLTASASYCLTRTCACTKALRSRAMGLLCSGSVTPCDAQKASFMDSAKLSRSAVVLYA